MAADEARSQRVVSVELVRPAGTCRQVARSPVARAPASRRGPRRVRRSCAGIAAVGLALGGCSEPGPDTEAGADGVRLELLASSAEVPYMESPTFALTGSDGVCVLDSYAIEIQCGDRSWKAPDVVAREGAGPGEIGGSGHLLTLPGSGVVFLDIRNRRLSFFDAREGVVRYTGSARAPPLFGPAGDMEADSSLIGFRIRARPRSSSPALTIGRLDMTNGALQDTTVLSVDVASTGVPVAEAVFVAAVVAPDRRILVKAATAGGAELLWFAPDGAFLGRLDSPDLGPILPTERDLEERADEYRRIFRRPLPDRRLDEIRDRPMGFLSRGSLYRKVQFDGRGRAWIHSNRPDPDRSYLEVFETSDHRDALAIPGRLLAFQIHDTVLVALVEANTRGPDEIYPRRFDWYRIAERR